MCNHRDSVSFSHGHTSVNGMTASTGSVLGIAGLIFSIFNENVIKCYCEMLINKRVNRNFADSSLLGHPVLQLHKGKIVMCPIWHAI